uniref:Putative secreted protein n=1 Tax=Ixodes ricinus TaxID=34613 RepID=A0A6B0UKQ6_IXORI
MACTSWASPTMALCSLSASPSVCLNCSCASIRPCISSMVWTMNMSTRSSRAPSSQLLKGATRLANSRCRWSIFSSTRSASSRAERRFWVRVPSRSHWSQMRWQRAFTLAESW